MNLTSDELEAIREFAFLQCHDENAKILCAEQRQVEVYSSQPDIYTDILVSSDDTIVEREIKTETVFVDIEIASGLYAGYSEVMDAVVVRKP